MLLERLRDYSQRIEATPARYKRTPVRWIVDLDASGNPLDVVRTEGSGKKNDRGKELLAPHIARSSGVRANLLIDNGEYALGVPRPDKKEDKDREKKAKRVAESHAAFLNEAQQCLHATHEPSVAAVVSFLEKPTKKLTLPEDFDPLHNVTFRVDGVLPIDLPAVRGYWAARKEGSGDPSSASMECIVCGQSCIPEKRLEFKLKGIPGGQTAGTALISANVRAFESYGLEASMVAPTCAECAERFTKAANELITGERTHITVGKIVYIFWTKEETLFSVVELLKNPEPEQVRALIESAFSGKSASVVLDPYPFYACALSASGGRAVVRDWIDTTVPAVQRNLARFFALQGIVAGDGGEGAPLGIFALATATLREKSKNVAKDLNPSVPRSLLHCALGGGAIAPGLLFEAVKRCRLDQSVTRRRAALIKLTLLAQGQDFQEDDMVELNTQIRDPAYLCGRLLAVLESAQRQAIPGANTTIIDRFYGTASTAPASVFGHLMKSAQAHLSKLRRDRQGAYQALQKRLEEIVSGLDDYPKVLTLEKQGLFALGYYHQRAADRAGAAAHRQAKEKLSAQDDAENP